MKRFLSILLLLALLPAAGLGESLPGQVTLTPGESRTFVLPYFGYWESDDPDVAEGDGQTITAYNEGCAVLTLVGEEGEFAVEVAVEAAQDSVPPAIRRAIEIGLQEWRENLGRSLPRSDSNKPSKNNKYTTWWGYDCGWCGAFANYCLDMAGVPLEPSDTYKKVKPTADGEPHSLREAAVPKLDTGFENMQRITQTDPRPGYLVIYGRRDSKSNGKTVSAYAFVHVGLITQVEDLGNGKFLLSTVEGNLSNQIKRFCYVYDANSPANKKKPDLKANLNMSPAPEDRRTEADVQYEPHQSSWYVTEFCMTWY